MNAISATFYGTIYFKFG